ncbi:kinesin, partial [Reticulomyxa filosa]
MPPVYLDSQSVRLARDNENSQKPYKCTLDRIFSSESTQAEAFVQIGKPMVDAALEGYNATIFCYGQSGAGKSFTMFGPETSDKERAVDKELNGIVPRCIEYLLQCLTERTNMMSRAFSATDDDDDQDDDDDDDEQEDDKAPSIIKEWK